MSVSNTGSTTTSICAVCELNDELIDPSSLRSLICAVISTLLDPLKLDRGTKEIDPRADKSVGEISNPSASETKSPFDSFKLSDVDAPTTSDSMTSLVSA